jgi:hypothetical protein
MLETMFNTLMNEHGALVALELLMNVALCIVIRIMYKRNNYLEDKLLETVAHNTKVITQLVEKLESHD